MSRMSLGRVTRTAREEYDQPNATDAVLSTIVDESNSGVNEMNELAGEVDELAGVIADGVGTTIALNAAQGVVSGSSEMTAAEAESVLAAVQMLRNAVSVSTVNYSRESFSSNGKSNRRMAMEGIGSTIKAFFAAIIAAVKRFGQWIASFFTSSTKVVSNGAASADKNVQDAKAADAAAHEAGPEVAKVVQAVEQGAQEHAVEQAVAAAAVAQVMEADSSITHQEAVQAVQEEIRQADKPVGEDFREYVKTSPARFMELVALSSDSIINKFSSGHMVSAGELLDDVSSSLEKNLSGLKEFISGEHARGEGMIAKVIKEKILPLIAGADTSDTVDDLANAIREQVNDVVSRFTEGAQGQKQADGTVLYVAERATVVAPNPSLVGRAYLDGCGKLSVTINIEGIAKKKAKVASNSALVLTATNLLQTAEDQKKRFSEFRSELEKLEAYFSQDRLSSLFSSAKLAEDASEMARAALSAAHAIVTIQSQINKLPTANVAASSTAMAQANKLIAATVAAKQAVIGKSQSEAKKLAHKAAKRVLERSTNTYR